MIKQMMKLQQMFLNATTHMVANETEEHKEYPWILENKDSEVLRMLKIVEAENMAENIDNKYWRFRDEIFNALIGG